jgi:hypothetical protein
MMKNSRNKGNFTEFMERETGYTWDGTLEGKIALMRELSVETLGDQESYIFSVEASLIPILAQMELH